MLQRYLCTCRFICDRNKYQHVLKGDVLLDICLYACVAIRESWNDMDVVSFEGEGVVLVKWELGYPFPGK